MSTLRVCIALAGLAGSVVPVASRACEPPWWWSASAAPADGASLPAHVTALPAFPGASYVCGPPYCTWQVLELRDGAGLVVPSRIVAEADASEPVCGGWTWLVPDLPLAVGARYRLLFSDPAGTAICDEGTAWAVREHGFTVIDAVPPPVSLGTVAAGEPVLGAVRVGTAAGSCTVEVEAVSVALDYRPSAEAVPLLPVTRWTVVVDGSVWARTDYGGIAADRTVTTMAVTSTRRADALYGQCSPGSPASDPGLAPGVHDVAIRARIAGEAEDVPVARMSVEIPHCQACAAQPDGTACDDLDPCTRDDRCQAGRCAGTPAPGEPCDDGSACTSGDTCDAQGACRGGVSTCDDGNPCTADACSGVDCSSEPLPDGSPCDDADPCTAPDACDAGACSGTWVCAPEPSPGEPRREASGCGSAGSGPAGLVLALLASAALARRRRRTR